MRVDLPLIWKDHSSVTEHMQKVPHSNPGISCLLTSQMEVDMRDGPVICFQYKESFYINVTAHAWKSWGHSPCGSPIEDVH